MKQLSEVWRRGIVLPLTRETAIEMSECYVSEESEVKYLPIRSDSLFDELWKTNLFQEINSSCNTLIDDYEEEELRPEALSSALRKIIEKRSSGQSKQVSIFLEDLENLFREAIELTFPVYFVL